MAIYTCQRGDQLIGRRQENQWLGVFHGGAGPLQNPLFLTNVTKPSKDIGKAAYPTRELLTTPAHASLADIRARESDDTTRDVESGAVASVAAFDPTLWTRLRFRLWREPPAQCGDAQLYRVGHVSLSKAR